MLELTDQELLGTPLRTWLYAFLASGALVVLAVLLRKLSERHLGQAVDSTRTRFNDSLIQLMRSTRIVTIFVLATYASVRLLGVSDQVLRWFEPVTLFFVLLQIGWWGSAMISFWTDPDEGRPVPHSVQTLGRIILWTVLCLVGAENLGFDVTAALTGLGIGGIAVALAAQQIMGDLLAFVSIVSDEPFRKGDFLVVGDWCGNVEYIGLRSTRIRALSGEQIVFSNSRLLDATIQNFKTMKSRRIVMSLGVLYSTPPDKIAGVPQIFTEIIDSIEGVRLDRVHFNEYAESSLGFEIVYYIQSGDYTKYMDIRQQINLAVLERFAQVGIGFAYPTRTVQLERDASSSSPVPGSAVGADDPAPDSDDA